MLSNIYNAGEESFNVLVVDNSYHRLHRLKRLLFSSIPNLNIRGYNPVYKGYPGDDFDWGSHDIVMLDSCIAQHKSFDYLRDQSLSKNPCTIMLTGPYCECTSEMLDLPGVCERLPRDEVSPDTLGSIINKATQSRLSIRDNTTHTPVATGTGSDSSGTHDRFGFKLPFSSADIENGTAHIDGYKLERLIGVGGMSAAYLATRIEDNLKVVIKTLKPSMLDDDRIIDRFIMEFTLAKDIDHPNIVKIYDQRFTDDFAFIVMEYLPGASLTDVSRYSMSPQGAARYALDIAAALESLHKAGIVHRDIKPSNFHFNANNGLVLLDFGISKKIDENKELTRIGEAVGTPHYMSPEQVLERPIDGRSDLYALGIILYKMLTGRHPFRANSALSIMYKHVNDQAPKLTGEFGALGNIVSKLLEKSPEDRYQSAGPLYADLKNYLDTCS